MHIDNNWYDIRTCMLGFGKGLACMIYFSKFTSPKSLFVERFQLYVTLYYAFSSILKEIKFV